jgi:hypothetical protein
VGGKGRDGLAEKNALALGFVDPGFGGESSPWPALALPFLSAWIYKAIASGTIAVAYGTRIEPMQSNDLPGFCVPLPVDRSRCRAPAFGV